MANLRVHSFAMHMDKAPQQSSSVSQSMLKPLQVKNSSFVVGVLVGAVMGASVGMTVGSSIGASEGIPVGSSLKRSRNLVAPTSTCASIKKQRNRVCGTDSLDNPIMVQILVVHFERTLFVRNGEKWSSRIQ